jgi:hypothetical protein
MRISWPRVEPSAEPIWMIDGQRRSQRLHQRHHRPDDAGLVVDGVHHLGHAVALGFGGEILDHEGDKDAADHRNQDHQGAPRRRAGEQVRVVAERNAAREGEIVDEADQVAKTDRAEAGDHADQQRQGRERRQPEPAMLLGRHGAWGRRLGGGVDTARRPGGIGPGRGLRHWGRRRPSSHFCFSFDPFISLPADTRTSGRRRSGAAAVGDATIPDEAAN